MDGIDLGNTSTLHVVPLNTSTITAGKKQQNKEQTEKEKPEAAPKKNVEVLQSPMAPWVTTAFSQT